MSLLKTLSPASLLLSVLAGKTAEKSTPGSSMLQSLVSVPSCGLSISPTTAWIGYGQTGPFREAAGYDVIIEAEAGLMHMLACSF